MFNSGSTTTRAPNVSGHDSTCSKLCSAYPYRWVHSRGCCEKPEFRLDKYSDTIFVDSLESTANRWIIKMINTKLKIGVSFRKSPKSKKSRDVKTNIHHVIYIYKIHYVCEFQK